MPKKDPKPKNKVSQNLTQKEKFIEYSREVEADETGATFMRAVKKITARKTKR